MYKTLTVAWEKGHRSLRQPDRFLPILAALAALVTYFLTLSADLTWAYGSSDGAELISAACTLGVPHPPGYPTYVLLGRAVCALPLQPVARTFHLLSAGATALAAGFVTATVRYRVAPAAYSARGALAAGLFFAWLLPIWQQAVVAEVYALNLALLAAFLWALLGHRPAWLGGLLLGLSITTHLTSLLMLPLALALIPPRRWPLLAAGLLLGLLPFLVLPLLARSDSPVIWGRPSTPAGWWWLVSAHLYRPNLLALPLEQWGARLREWAAALLPQLAPVGLLLLPGARRGPRATRVPRSLLFLPSLLLYLIYAFTYATADSLVFLLPALLLLSVLLGRPLQLRPTLALFLPIILLLLNFITFKPGMDPSVRSLAAPVLKQAPPGAILLTAGDRSTFSLWYFQSVEHKRPDLLVVDRNLLGFAWYRQRLRRREPELGGLTGYNLEQFRRANERPVCDVNLEEADTQPASRVLSCPPSAVME